MIDEIDASLSVTVTTGEESFEVDAIFGFDLMYSPVLIVDASKILECLAVSVFAFERSEAYEFANFPIVPVRRSEYAIDVVGVDMSSALCENGSGSTEKGRFGRLDKGIVDGVHVAEDVYAVKPDANESIGSR